MNLNVHKECLILVKNSESKREKSVELKVPSKRKSVTSSHSSNKKIENSDISKDVNNSIENQENQVNCVNNNDDISDDYPVSDILDTGSKAAECCQTNTGIYFFLF